MNVTATDIINSLYHPTDILHLRVFDDKKRGIFTGQKLSVEAGKFATIEKMLRDHNEQGHGIFFVVNQQHQRPVRGVRLPVLRGDASED